MQVTIHTQKPARSKRNPLQARFDKLRGQVEREQRKNEKLARELDELTRWLAAQQREIEQGVLEASCGLCARLMELFKRKSLLQWQREELVEWISEVQDQIMAIDPDAAQQLHQQFIEALGQHFEMSKEEMQDRFDAFFESIDSGFETDEDADFAGPEQPDLFSDEVEDPVEDEPWASQDDRATEPESGGAGSSGSGLLADADWLRRLFRRAAQALHPDRETDPQRRCDKQMLMQQLLRARKEGDVLTMLELYADASGQQELALAEIEMKQACELMKQRLDRLKGDQFEIINQSPMHGWAHQEFYRVKQATREKKLNRWKQEARAEARDLARITGELKNLKVLKAYLETRREQKFRSIEALDVLFGERFY